LLSLTSSNQAFGKVAIDAGDSGAIAQNRFIPGTLASITATPSLDSWFTKWTVNSGTISGFTPSLANTTIRMSTASAGLTANFEQSNATSLTAQQSSITASTWSNGSDFSHSGATSLKSKDISDNGSTTLAKAVTILPGMKYLRVAFWYSIASEKNYDFLKVYHDGTPFPQSGWSGNYPGVWNAIDQYISVNPGATVEIKWVYSKDYSVSVSYDAAWVDDILIAQYPSLP